MLDTSEGKAGLVDLFVIFALLDVSAPIKSDAVVIFYGGKPFVGHFDGASTKHIHPVLLNNFSPFQSFLIKHSCLDQGALVVDQVNVQDLTLTLLVLICSHFGLLHNSRFNPPVLAVLVEAPDRQVAV